MKTILSAILFLICCPEGYSQSKWWPAYEDSTIAHLEPLVKARFGNKYTIGVEVFDSLTGTAHRNCELITDPYGTLQHCIFFYASKDSLPFDSGFVGMFKNGTLIWHSKPLIGGAPHRLFGAQDINKDGTVDLMTTWYDPDAPNGDEEMWIFSWNGSSGSIINGVDTSNDETSSVIWAHGGFSLIHGLENGEDFIQANIPNFDGSEDTTVVYSWNGSVYTKETWTHH
jgi:hypothetical protein